MQLPTYLIRAMWSDHSRPSKFLWAFIATIVEIFLWLLFLIFLVIMLLFYIIITPVYYLCIKKDCKCRHFIVIYFHICFSATALFLIVFGTHRRHV
jgi:hypothetical protein